LIGHIRDFFAGGAIGAYARDLYYRLSNSDLSVWDDLR
jgi:hypothetical protein